MTSPAPTPTTSARHFRRPVLNRILWVGAILLVAVLSLRIPVPAYVLVPGPVFPLADAVMIEGASPIDGDYLFLTVQLDDARVVDTFTAAFDSDAQIVSRASVLGDESEEEFIARQVGLFDAAEIDAIQLGLALADSNLATDDVVIDTEGVGGPSAGLLTSLAVADLASPLNVAAGRIIAGTGTVAADGTVGPVSSVQDKMRAAEDAGAEVFLIPAGLEGQVSSASTTMTLIPVSSVQEAFEALTTG